jgi:hypothetical protein
VCRVDPRRETSREEEGNTWILLSGLSVSGGMSLSCKYSQVTSDQLKGMDKLNKTKYFVYIYLEPFPEWTDFDIPVRYAGVEISAEAVMVSEL